MVLDKYFAQVSYGHQPELIKQTLGDTATDTQVIVKFTIAVVVHWLKHLFALASLRFGQGLENLLPTQPRHSLAYVFNRSTDKPRRY